MEKLKLTKKQKAVFDFIKRYIEEKKQGPFIREIQDEIGRASCRERV